MYYKLNIGIELLCNICLSAWNECEMPKSCPQCTKHELDAVHLQKKKKFEKTCFGNTDISMPFSNKIIWKVEVEWPNMLSGEIVTVYKRMLRIAVTTNIMGFCPVASCTFFGDKVSDILDNYVELVI